MSKYCDPEETILENSHTIAVVGLTAKKDRPSYMVAEYLQKHNYRIIPVNPRANGEILGEKVYASLDEVPVPVDLVNIFRRPEHTDEPIDAAIRIGAKAVWLQLGIINEHGMERAKAAGLLAVQDKCLKVEHERLYFSKR